MPEGSKFQMSL